MTNDLLIEIERLRDEVARERLARHNAEKWLKYVAEEIKRLQICVVELETENARLRQIENSQVILYS